MDVMFSTLFSNQIHAINITETHSLRTTFSDFQYLNGQHISCIAEVIGIINTKLNSSKSRISGLSLLDSLIKQCNTKVFEENAMTWIKILFTILQSFDPTNTKSLCHLVLGQMLKHVFQFPELSREFCSSSLPAIIGTLLSVKPQLQWSALHCLYQCMKNFPGACGPQKGKIEGFTGGLLENENNEIQRKAIECYTLLPRLGGGGSQGIKHAEAWSLLASRILISLQSTMKSLYECVDLEDEGNDDLHVGGIKFTDLSEDTLQRTEQLKTRYHTLCKCLRQLLRTDYSVAVNVPVRDILGVVQKSLSVTPQLLMNRPTQERVMLANALPRIYEYSLIMIDTLILCVAGNLIPYSKVINQYILQLLNVTDMPRTYGSETPYRMIRKCTWNTLHTWMCTVGLSSGVENVIDDITKHIFLDIIPVGDTVKVQNTNSKKLSDVSEHFHGKKKKKGGSSHIGQITNQRKLDSNADSTTCTAALSVLQEILKSTGPVLNENIYRKINETVITILLRVSHCSSRYIPYGNVECKLKLYQTLLTCLQNPHDAIVPPTQCSVNLFSMGTKERDRELCNFCKEALSCLETIIHPRAPSLYAPVFNTKLVQHKGNENDGKCNFNNETLHAETGIFSKQNIEEYGHTLESYQSKINFERENFTNVPADVITHDKATHKIEPKNGKEENKLKNIDSDQESDNVSDQSSEPEISKGDISDNDDTEGIHSYEPVVTIQQSDVHVSVSDEENSTVTDVQSLSLSETTISHDVKEPIESSVPRVKRKWETENVTNEFTEAGPSKKQMIVPEDEDDRKSLDHGQTDLMLQSFVDADPDSD